MGTGEYSAMDWRFVQGEHKNTFSLMPRKPGINTGLMTHIGSGQTLLH